MWPLRWLRQNLPQPGSRRQRDHQHGRSRHPASHDTCTSLCGGRSGNRRLVSPSCLSCLLAVMLDDTLNLEGLAMQGDKKVIEYLNQQLTYELTAINQYFMHAKMQQNWGFKKLAEKIRAESIEEMKHAEHLMDRILFLEGIPNLQDLNKLNIGENVEEQLKLDLALEMRAAPPLREALQYCRNQGDDVSKALFQKLLEDTEKHIDWIETQLELVQKVGIHNYLQSHM
jgi:bacterioferritin